MGKVLAILAMTIGVLGVTARDSGAQTIGPVCFSNFPFTDHFLMFFTPTGGGQYTGSGKVLNGNTPNSNTPMSVQAFLAPTTATISFTAGTPSTGGGHLFSGTADVSLATGSGPGRCETVNSILGCGSSSAFILEAVACPAGADAQAPGARGERARRSMDGT